MLWREHIKRIRTIDDAQRTLAELRGLLANEKNTGQRAALQQGITELEGYITKRQSGFKRVT